MEINILIDEIDEYSDTDKLAITEEILNFVETVKRKRWLGDTA